MALPPNPLLAALVTELRRDPQQIDDVLAVKLGVGADIIRTIRNTDMFRMVLNDIRRYERE